MPEHPLGVTRNAHFNLRLSKIETAEDIPEHWRGTPIAALIGAHNFDQPIDAAGSPELLIATCIEFRFMPKVPAMYAYLIRRASGRLIGYVSMHAGRYAIEDEVDSLEAEYFRLKSLFKKIELAPLFVSLSSQKLYLPNWYLEHLAAPVKEEEEQVAAEDYLMLS